MSTKIAAHQYNMLQTNRGFIKFVHTNDYPVFSMTEDDYYRLTVAARIGACGNCLSCMDRGEWSKCTLRKTLDTVPCREGIHEKQQFDAGICPFAIIDREEFQKMAESQGVTTP